MCCCFHIVFDDDDYDSVVVVVVPVVLVSKTKHICKNTHTHNESGARAWMDIHLSSNLGFNRNPGSPFVDFCLNGSSQLLQFVTWIDSPNGGHVFSPEKVTVMGPFTRSRLEEPGP